MHIRRGHVPFKPSLPCTTEFILRIFRIVSGLVMIRFIRIGRRSFEELVKKLVQTQDFAMYTGLMIYF